MVAASLKNSPVTLATIGRLGPTRLSRRSALTNGTEAGATIEVWKAWLTGMRIALIPLPANTSMIASTALVAPPTTAWL